MEINLHLHFDYDAKEFLIRTLGHKMALISCFLRVNSFTGVKKYFSQFIVRKLLFFPQQCQKVDVLFIIDIFKHRYHTILLVTQTS